MDCSPPGPSVHGIFQARVLEWGAIAFSDSKHYCPSTSCYIICPKLLYIYMSFSGGSAVEPANAGVTNLINESGRDPGEGNGNPLQYYCLKNCIDRGAWWATAHGVTRVQHGLVTIQQQYIYSPGKKVFVLTINETQYPRHYDWAF